MAGTVIQSCVRIRIAEIKLCENKKIQPFWLLVQFDRSPFISDVEDKIVSVLNSLIATNQSGSLASRGHSYHSTILEPSTDPNQDPNETRSRSRSFSLKLTEQSHLQNITPVNITENDDTVVKTHIPENECCGSGGDTDGENIKIFACKLWMEGFLLLSSERSQIFQNGDLVTVKCEWRRFKKTVTEENVISVNANGNGHAEGPLLKKQKKKRKHENSFSVNESFEDNDESHKSSEHVCNSSFQDSLDSAQKKKSKYKKSKRDKSVLEENTPQSINENGTYEQDAKYCEDPGSKTQTDSGEGLKGLSCQDSDLLQLMNKKIEELAENHRSPPKISSDPSETLKSNDEFQRGSTSKRKRRRKRKKKANDNTATQTQEKTTPTVKVKFSPLKLPSGCQPENTRLTFETESESDEPNLTSSITCNEKETTKQMKENGYASSPLTSLQDKGVSNHTSSIMYNEKEKTKKKENVYASSPLTSLQNKGVSEFKMVESSVSRSESILVNKEEIQTDKVSHLKSNIQASPLRRSPTSDIVHGQSVNPNSKFDELLQRRKLSGNNCSVSTLHNGAFVFTRERQRGEKKESGRICQTVTNMMSSEERQSDTPESIPLKEETKDTSHATTIAAEAQKMSCLPKPSTLIEVTPVYLDVERCKALEGLPQAGDIIAYKILELSHDYTPGLSDFKQGQVISCEDGIVQMELFENSVPKKRSGRFELKFEQEGEEDETYCNKNYVSVEVASMVDARLVQRC